MRGLRIAAAPTILALAMMAPAPVASAAEEVVEVGVSFSVVNTNTSRTASTAGFACQELMIPVSIAKGLPATETIYGQLCLPSEPTGTVHVLVTPSLTNRTYFDPAFEPERYSYRRALNEAGYATLLIEPVGSGGSSHPPSALVTVDAAAFELHQIVGMLRAGSIGGRSFERVVANGLSNGSLVAVTEAAAYRDVDALILTGYAFAVDVYTVAMEGGPTFRPAWLESKFADKGLDPGYLTATLDFFQDVVLSPNGYEPAMVEYVAAAQDTTTLGYLALVGAGIGAGSLGPPVSPSTDVDVPVLLAVGTEDKIFCTTSGAGTDCSTAETLRAAVAPGFPNVPRLDTFVLPDAGHNMNWARNATEWFTHAIGWSDGVVGKS